MNILWKLLNTVLKVKKEDGLKCISCLPLWSWDWLGTVALCCTESRESIYDILLAAEEKIQTQNLMYGFYYVHITFASLCSPKIIKSGVICNSNICLRTIRLIWQEKLSRSINFPVLIKASFYKNAYNTHNFQKALMLFT